MTQVINWIGDSGDGVYIGGGDPKDTNHTPLKTMFTIKKSSKNKSNKKSTRKGGKSINKPELAVDLDIDTSIDASNKGFTLSRGINRKLEKGHIDHVVKTVGINYVGLGSDFDGVGDTLPEGLKDASMYPKLITELLNRDYTHEDIEKICSGNVLRVWRAVEAYAAQQASDTVQ